MGIGNIVICRPAGGLKLVYGNQSSKIGRKGVPDFRSRKVYCGFPGVCSYLRYVICILCCIALFHRTNINMPIIIFLSVLLFIF